MCPCIVVRLYEKQSTNTLLLAIHEKFHCKIYPLYGTSNVSVIMSSYYKRTLCYYHTAMLIPILKWL